MQRLVLGTAFVVVLGLIGVLLAFALGVLPRGTEAIDDVSPEAAAAAEEKLSRVAAGEQVSLNATELTSLFRYRPDVWSIGPVESPVVEMTGDTIRVRGLVPKEKIPPEVEIGPLRALLPDTTRVDIAGTVRSLDAGEIVLEIASVEVEGMPIPSRFYAQIMRADVLSLPLPAGIGSARIIGGELILTP